MNFEFLYRQFNAKGIVDGTTEERDFFVPTLTLQYAQPLLKNAFGMLDRLPIAIAGLDNKITEWTVSEENSYLLANYKKLYMQWVVYAQSRDFLMQSLENARTLERLSREQRQVGYIDDADLLNSQMLVMEIQNQLLDVNNAYTNLQHQVSLIVKEEDIQPDTNEWNLLNQEIQNSDLAPIGFEDTRQALILDFMQEKIKHYSGAVRNSRLPELNALLNVGMEVYSTNSAATNRADFEIVPAFYAGLQLKYPINNIDHQANSLELRKNRLEYDLYLQKYTSEFNYKMQEKTRNIDFYRNKINNRQSMGSLLQSRYNAEYRTFTQGRGALAQLIDTRNEMLRNRIDEADIQLRLIFEYFDYEVMNNQDEISRSI